MSWFTQKIQWVWCVLGGQCALMCTDLTTTDLHWSGWVGWAKRYHGFRFVLVWLMCTHESKWALCVWCRWVGSHKRYNGFVCAWGPMSAGGGKCADKRLCQCIAFGKSSHGHFLCFPYAKQRKSLISWKGLCWMSTWFLVALTCIDLDGSAGPKDTMGLDLCLCCSCAHMRANELYVCVCVMSMSWFTKKIQWVGCVLGGQCAAIQPMCPMGMLSKSVLLNDVWKKKVTHWCDRSLFRSDSKLHSAFD